MFFLFPGALFLKVEEGKGTVQGNVSPIACFDCTYIYMYGEVYMQNMEGIISSTRSSFSCFSGISSLTKDREQYSLLEPYMYMYMKWPHGNDGRNSMTLAPDVTLLIFLFDIFNNMTLEAPLISLLARLSVKYAWKLIFRLGLN